MDKYLNVPLGLIFWKSPLRDFSSDDIRDMAESFKIHGQIEPIVCKLPDAEGKYEGVVGRLRYEGARRAKLPEILVRVHTFEDEDEIVEWQLVENLHRKELTALEKSDGLTRLVELRKKRFPEDSAIRGVALAVEAATGEEMAERTVRENLRISRGIGNKARKIGNALPKKKALNVKTRHLQELSRVKNEDKQAELYQKTAEREWTVPKLKKEINRELGLTVEPPEPIDTGLVITCPTCKETYILIHIEEGSHRLQKIVVMESGH